MSLPAETKFLCRDDMDSSITFAFDLRDQLYEGEPEESRIYIETDSGDFGISGVYINRSQVESLRDQLTAWLNATKD